MMIYNGAGGTGKGTWDTCGLICVRTRQCVERSKNLIMCMCNYDRSIEVERYPTNSVSSRTDSYGMVPRWM